MTTGNTLHDTAIYFKALFSDMKETILAPKANLRALIHMCRVIFEAT